MSSKTIKEFAQEINLDKKQLQNKLAYWKKKGKSTWNFSDTFSDGIRILTEPEQKRIYELLEIPIFRQFSDDSEPLLEDDSSFEHSLFKEKILLLENQLLEIKSDKEYLKNQILKGQNEKEELLKSNSELRILLQHTIKQNGTLQNALSEFTTENLKKEIPENADTSDENQNQNASEKSSEFYFNPSFAKNNTNTDQKIEIEAVKGNSVTTEKRNPDVVKEKNYNFVDPPKKTFSFDELHPDFNGFLSEFFKYGQQTGNWKISYRRARRLAKAKKQERKKDNKNGKNT